VRDLTQGSIPKHILSMSLPTMSGLMLQGLYDIVDMIWIGQISYQAVAAITIFASIFWIFEVLNEIIGMSSVSLISQSYGAGDIKRTAVAAEQTITCKFLIASLAAILLCIFLKPMLHLFTDDRLVTEYAKAYGYLRAATIPIFFSSFSVNTIFRCTGDAKTPMFLLIGSAVINIILDPILMFDSIPGTSLPGAGLGMFGAALATVLANVVALGIGMLLLLSGKSGVHISPKRLFRLVPVMDKKLLTIGLPSGFEMLFRNTANTVFIKMVGVYGTAAVALIGVGLRIYSFIFMPIMGIVMGSGTIAGQNLGANQIDRSRATAWYSSLIGSLLTAVLITLVLLRPQVVLGWFLTDLDEIRQGVIMLSVVLPSLVIAAFSLGWASVFSGSGYTIPFLLSSFVAKWAVMIPYSAVVIYRFHTPLTYVWISFILSEIAEMIVLGRFFHKGAWKYRRV